MCDAATKGSSEEKTKYPWQPGMSMHYNEEEKEEEEVREDGGEVSHPGAVDGSVVVDGRAAG